ncbi:MAG: hypothetical protein ACPGQL_09210 [Thermoplasmatota archaeon]
MAFSKYDPHKPEPQRPGIGDDTARRRALILRWGWLVSLIYLGIGYVVIALVLSGRWP